MSHIRPHLSWACTDKDDAAQEDSAVHKHILEAQIVLHENVSCRRWSSCSRNSHPGMV